MEMKQLRKTEISFERTSSLGTVKMRGTRNFLFTTLSLSLSFSTSEPANLKPHANGR